MKNFLYYCSVIFYVIASLNGANATARGEFHNVAKNPPPMVLAAGNCAARANALASSYANAEIMTVTDNGNSCTIVIRVKDANGGRSRIIRKTVSG